VLHNEHDAEDAFQATFLVLARKAGSIRQAESVSSWLHGVAHRIAMETKRKAARRRAHERRVPRHAPQPAISETAWQDLQEALDEELRQLPEKYRAPFILCCLENKSLADAAKQLGWKVGTVSGRLSKARHILQDRLSKRGVMLSAVLTGLAVGPSAATAAVPAVVANATTDAALAFATGSIATAGIISANVLALTKADLKGMLFTKVKIVTALVLTMTLAATAVGIAAHQVLRPGDKTQKSARPAEEPTAGFEKKPREPRVDLYGDPLPEGAIARLGTVRMRHACIITGAAFSSDGKSIIASDAYSGVHVWDVAEGREVRQFFKNEQCGPLAVSPDGRTLAVAGGFGPGCGTVRLCDPSSGRVFGSLAKDSGKIGDLVFSNDGSLLATAAGDKSVGIWDVATQRLIRELTFAVNVGHVAFSSDGKLLACGTWDGHCRLWDLAQDKEVRQLRNEPAGQHSLYAIFAPNGGPMAVWGYEDASIRLFDANGVKEIRRFKQEGTAPTESGSAWGWLYSIHMSFSSDGKILAICRNVDRTRHRIDLWDVGSGKKLHTLVSAGFHGPSLLFFSPDGSKFASAGGDLWGGDNIIRVWDVTQGKEILPFTGHGSPISSVAISPNGNSVATAGQDGVIHLWERSSGRNLLRLEGDRGRWRQVSFSSDGQRLISWGTYDHGTLRIWDARTGQALSRVEQQSPEAYWTAVSDNGNTALSIEQGKSVRFHDLTTGRVIREFVDASRALNPMALSPAGDKMVSFDGAGTDALGRQLAILMNAADGKKLVQIPIKGVATGSCSSAMQHPWLSFSADGRRLATAVTRFHETVSGTPTEIAVLAFDGTPTEIAVFDGKELRRFGKKIGDRFYGIDAAAISRDGKTVVTGVGDCYKPDEQIITLWETETGRERGHFLGHRGKTQALAISSDCRWVVSGGDDTSALVWDATKPRNSSIRHESAAVDLAAHFRNLAGNDAEQAYASIWALVNAQNQTVSFLRDHATTDVQKIQRWIRDLDSDKFAERERASQELGYILDEAEPYLKKALKNKPSAEVRRRIDLLLQRLAGAGRELQRLRALEVLEHIAAPSADATRLAAIDLLKKLAAGAPEARLTQEAKASLDRLERRADMRH
jgi:RNA polymerase sigma factor (sigma-70 family)